MRPITLRFAIFVLILGGFLSLPVISLPYRHAIASLAWQTTHADAIADFLSPRDPALWLDIGSYYFGHGAYDLGRASRAYARVLVLDPTNRDAHYQLGRIAFLDGDFPRAIEHIDQAVDRDPNFAKAYYMKGLILGYRGSLIEAVEYFERYIRLVPDSWAGYNDLAWLQFQLGRYSETLAATTKGLAHSPENVWLLNMHGLALMNLDRRDEAKDFFLRAKRLSDQMLPQDWGRAYPGNDPAIYPEGLERMREAIDHNLGLLYSVEVSHKETGS